MKGFMDSEFLLSNKTAQDLYHKYAETMPIIDYHCHINASEIYEDRQFDNITRIWLGGDHYKWRLMRANGVDEELITGSASDHDKFIAWAETIEKAIGNPVYQWSHLELRRYFGYEGVLNSDTAEQVWNLCNEKLAMPEMSARNIMRSSGVKLICTTDDPIDSLGYHEKLAADKSFEIRVLPAWRPDKALNIDQEGFPEYIEKLGRATGIEIRELDDLKAALIKRMEFFTAHGCKLADHGLEYVMYGPDLEDDVNRVFVKGMNGQSLDKESIISYKTALMLFLGEQYKKSDWTMQLHYGCKRNNSDRSYKKLGPDTGFDCILNGAPGSQLADYLNALDSKDMLPRTIIYSLDPNDNAVIETIMGCFQSSECIGKLQHGSAWWFNDSKAGMQNQMRSLAGQGVLANFVGMLTDSRSFISYTRHEYFRRILCDIIGTWVEDGEYPADEARLGRMVQDIAYNNAVRYFKF